jgi:hypothetical protein
MECAGIILDFNVLYSLYECWQYNKDFPNDEILKENLGEFYIDTQGWNIYKKAQYSGEVLLRLMGNDLGLEIKKLQNERVFIEQGIKQIIIKKNLQLQQSFNGIYNNVHTYHYDNIDKYLSSKGYLEDYLKHLGINNHIRFIRFVTTNFTSNPCSVVTVYEGYLDFSLLEKIIEEREEIFERLDIIDQKIKDKLIVEYNRRRGWKMMTRDQYEYNDFLNLD